MRSPSDRERAHGAVIVTGASSGIGLACVRKLDRLGYVVFAGVRRNADRERLSRLGSGVAPLILDVTNDDQIFAAVAEVERALPERGLAGLINNAGVMVSGPLECVPVAALREQLEVNVVGVAAVTQAFLPLLLASRGRIVNIGSTSGRIAGPFLGPYCASKFALEAITAALREELLPTGVGVHVVEPGSVGTRLWEKALNAERTLLDADRSGRYAGALSARQRMLERLANSSSSPEAVADAVADALTSPRPRARYVVGFDARLRIAMFRLLPRSLWLRLARRRRA